MKEGTTLMEVEFPPLPVSMLDDSSISAYELLQTNLQLALEYSKRLIRAGGDDGPKIALTLPDLPERKRAAQMFGGEREENEPFPKVQLWSLVGGAAEPSPFDFLSSVLKRTTLEAEVAPWAGIYIILGASCQELPTIRQLAERAPEGTTIICFNLKLDILRGDLGLPAFPPKSVHHDFLCKVKPVYFMRPRSYSLSLSRPPFLIAYSGVLFRRYPEGWQTLLERSRSSYRRVLVEETRPALGSFKASLTSALKLADEVAANSAISQAGIKQSTWWEDNDDNLDISKDWRA